MPAWHEAAAIVAGALATGAMHGAQAWIAAGALAPLAWLAGLGRPLPTLPSAGPGRTLTVMIAAHDEAHVIGGLLADLAAQAYPPGRWHVVVAADGCADATAAVARAAGAQALELPASGSKGAALAAAWRRLRAEGPAAEGVVVLDADNRVGPGFLAEIDRALEVAPVIQGIRRSHAPADGPGRLDHLAEWLNGRVEARGRAGLGLGVKIAGSAWAMRQEVAAAWGFESRTMVEDLELTARLVQAGTPVALAPAVEAWDEKVTGGPAFMRQRARWVRGRLAIARAAAPALLASGRPAGLEFGLYLLLPMRAVTQAGAIAFMLAAALDVPGAWPAWAWLLLAAAPAAHVVAGLALTGAGPAEWRALASAATHAWRPLLAFLRAPFAPARWGHTVHAGHAAPARPRP